MSDKRRDLEADLKLLTAIPRDVDEESDIVHDIIAPHALRRAIAAEALIEAKDAEIARLQAELRGIGVEEYYRLQVECREMAAEIERLREELDGAYSAYEKLQKEYERLDAEAADDVDALKQSGEARKAAEQEREQALAALDDERRHHQFEIRSNEIARAALNAAEREQDKLHQQLAEQTEALKWYADERIYEPHRMIGGAKYGLSEAEQDDGQTRPYHPRLL